MDHDDDENLLVRADDQDENEEIHTPLQSHHATSKSKSSYYLLPLAAAVASLGGILFGYDIGIISGAMLQLRSEFSLSCKQQEMVVTSLLIGCLLASLTGGQFLDRFGRKRTIIINALIFLGGALLLSFSKSYIVFIIGRFILGYAVSLSAVGDCVYISEIAPLDKRGLLVSLNELGITLGLLLAYLVNFFFINMEHGWRYMFGLSSIPAALQAFSMIFVPSSPRWLFTSGQQEKAKKVISMIWPDLNCEQEIDRFKKSLSSEQSYKLIDIFTEKENLRMRMFTGCGIILFQQLSGQPTVLYYAPALFETLGFDGHVSATLATVGLGAVKVVFTLVTICTVDKLGRRTFLLLGAFVMTISLITLSAVIEPFQNLNRTPCEEMIGQQKLHTHLLKPQLICTNTTQFYNNTNKTETYSNLKINIFSKNSLKNNLTYINCTHHKLQKQKVYVPTGIKYTCLIALMMFVIGYSLGYGPMSWLLLSEIFPTGIKARAVAVATSVNWGTHMILSMTFLDVLGSIGPFYTFLIYSLVSVTSIFFLCHFVPETKGKSLELISAELSNRSHRRCTAIHCCKGGQILHVENDEYGGLLDKDDLVVEQEDHNEHKF